MNTLLLDQTTWDLVLDAQGNIALASNPYSIAQDVASALRLFADELWYDTSKGVPYFTQILGQPARLPILKAQFERAALTVPNVLTAQCFITALANRTLRGQVQVTFSPDVSNPSETDATGAVGRALITFVGDDGSVITFVGGNGGVVSFYGTTS